MTDQERINILEKLLDEVYVFWSILKRSGIDLETQFSFKWTDRYDDYKCIIGEDDYERTNDAMDALSDALQSENT